MVIVIICKRRKTKSHVPQFKMNHYVIEKFQKNMEVAGDGVCPVDLMQIYENDLVALFPICRHVVHSACIEEWNRNQPGSCPGCCKTRGKDDKTGGFQ